MQGASTWGSILLLIGGLVHAIPQLYSGLSSLTANVPVIQIIIGILSVVVALIMLSHKKGE